MSPHRSFPVAIFVLILVAMAAARPALAQESQAPSAPEADAPAPKPKPKSSNEISAKFGGSAAVTWMGVEPSKPNASAVLTNRGATLEEGFMGEFAGFGTISMPKAAGMAGRVRANIRACYGCHGLEIESAHFTFEASAHFSFRAGRFALPLGGINSRHDQTVRVQVSKPLPQIMGGMIRGREFNQGVLPAPMSDNGFGATALVDGGDFMLRFDLFAVGGLKSGGSPDLSFVASRDYEDNNAEPAVGGRITADFDWIVVGGSGMLGNSDASGRNTYQFVTVDLSFNFGYMTDDLLGDLTLDVYAAQRRTEYFDAGGGESHFWKRGYWAQLSFSLFEDFKVAVSADGLFVSDIPLSPFGPTTFAGAAITDRSNQLNRGSAGFAWSLGSGIQAKGGIEYWDFSDFKDAVAYQVALAIAF